MTEEKEPAVVWQGAGTRWQRFAAGLALALQVVLLPAAAGPSPGEREALTVRSRCRDRYHLPADRPGVLPADNWTELELVLELRPLADSPGAWEVLAVDAKRIVRAEGEPPSTWRLPPSCRGTVLGRATWRGGDRPWKLEEEVSVPAECAPLSPAWASAVLDQSAGSREDRRGSRPWKQRVDRWRQFSGDWVALEIEGRSVPCGEVGAAGERCWRGRTRVMFPAGGKEKGRTVGSGEASLHCLPFPSQPGVHARFCRRKVWETTARITVPSTGRETDWSQRCEVTVEATRGRKP